MMSIKDWSQIKVKEICDIGRGRVISSQEIESRLGIYPVFSSQSQNRGEMGRIDTYDFDGEYVTWTTDGAYAGTVFYREGKFNCTNVCGTLKANSPQISMEFLAYKLSTLAKNYVSYVGNPKLMNNVMANIELSLPDNKKEQEQIADVLSTIDWAIAQTEAIISKQQRIKTGLMQDLLTKGIDENGNIRSEDTHEFKDSAIGRIPVEWNVEPCGSICKEIIVGIVIRPAQYYKPSGVPVLRSANVKENAIYFSDLVYMSEKDNDSLSKSRLFAGDLVTVRTGYPGTTAVIPPELDGCNCVDIVISRPDTRQVRSNFLALWINSDFGKKQVLEGQGGLAQQHFNVGEVRKLLVKVPTIEEQSRIENFLFIQSNSLLKYQQHLRKLHRAKTGLMQDLLTGKVRVTNLLKEKEPASQQSQEIDM